ncbi:hypothetical protein Bpfe_004618 [Biomphalaria pfeifferi]|uniref:Uncharacterized protein n=1 Tax=Biomphalaria pfeifferi TaxID=112525 RepID=A0AAD8C3J7_BIOPF|nr:hypothetical protein Bpfe_004618 [Biomphalaria pfeifferi]
MDYLTQQQEMDLLKEEFRNFKIEMVTRTEEQFFQVKSQIAILMDEIYLQNKNIQEVKDSLSNLSKNQNFSANGSSERNSSNFVNKRSRDQLKKENNLISHSKNTRKNTNNQKICGEYNQRSVTDTKYSTTRSSSFSDTIPLDMLNHSVVKCVAKQGNGKKQSSHGNSKQISQPNFPRAKICCSSCRVNEKLIRQQGKKTNKSLSKVKYLEKKLKHCIKKGSALFENFSQQLLHATDIIDENSFDIEQCWSETKSSRDKNLCIMLNGDLINLEDEISKMNFELEALWTQSEQHNALIEQLKTKLRLQIQFNRPPPDYIWKQEVVEALKNVEKMYDTMQMLFIERMQKLEKVIEHDIISRRKLKVHMLRKFPIDNAKGTIWKFQAPTVEDTMQRGSQPLVVYQTKYQCITAMKEYEDQSLEYSLDTMQRGSQPLVVYQTKYQCITAMKEYEDQSLEELRHLDYKKMDKQAYKIMSLVNLSCLNNNTATWNIIENSTDCNFLNTITGTLGLYRVPFSCSFDTNHTHLTSQAVSKPKKWRKSIQRKKKR